jgi:hypothetical protein
MPTYTQPHWKWYVAEFLTEIRVENDPRIVGAIEITLFYADSPEEAYSKARARVDSPDHGYRNSDGSTVYVRYLGIKDLDNLQQRELEDDTVISVQLMPNISTEQLHTFVRNKQQLSLFGTPPYDGPNIDQ